MEKRKESVEGYLPSLWTIKSCRLNDTTFFEHPMMWTVKPSKNHVRVKLTIENIEDKDGEDNK